MNKSYQFKRFKTIFNYLYKKNWKNHQSGEIAASLTLITVLVLGIGAFVGVWYAQNVQNPQTLLSDAQSCIYRSTAKVFKEVDGQLFQVSETIPPGPMEVTNDRNDVLALEAGGFSQASYNTESMIFDLGRVRNYARGDRASVTLSKVDVSEWRVGSVFCKQQNGSIVGCPTEGALKLINQRIQSGQSDGRTIPAFTVDCGVDVEYGWVLTSAREQSPTVAQPSQEPPTAKPSESPSPTLGDSCSYKTRVHIYEDQRDDNSNLSADVMSAGVMKITNDRGQALDLNDNGVARGGYETDYLLFDPTREREYAENDPATVTLSNIDTDFWQVKEVFCEQSADSVRGCPSQSDIDVINTAIQDGTDTGLALGEFRVNCGVDLDYGWVLERTGEQPTGNGSMEIKVVALNYPEKTSLWPEDHLANYKPASCSRQGSGEETRPLYLSSFEIRATCVGGGCEVGKQFENDAKKREGYVNIKDIPAGQYTLEIRDMADADDNEDTGYRVWSGCQDTIWTVNPDSNNTQAVVILENVKGNRYERRSTEKLCKDDGGIPNLIEGIDGNVCHLTGATGGGGGNDNKNPDELTVSVKNTIASVSNATVKLSPCPSKGPCEQNVAFKGKTTETVTFKSGKDSVHEVRIQNITSDSRTFSLIPVALAQENGNARVVEGCQNGVVFPDGQEDELCKTSAPDSIGFALVSGNTSRDEIPRRGDPDVIEEQPGDASDVFFGSCPVFASGKCSPAYLRRTFTDASDIELQKLSAICFRESSGSNVALNDSCLTGGRDMSAGLFQINTWVGGECVDVVDPATHGGARCQVRPGETRQCILALYNPDTNIQRAKGKWDGSRNCKKNPFCPWNAGPSERCKLAEYGDTYKNCNVKSCL